MKVFSLFSGCGGLDLGFERAGFEIPVANEFDSTIWETFTLNHPKTTLITSDVRKLPVDIFPSDIDGIIGGAENVSGMLANRHVEAVNFIVELFKSCGYDLTINLVNAKNYGVAQERRRVFYIGFRHDLNVNFQFPRGSTEIDSKKLTLRDVIWDLQFTAVPTVANNKSNPKAENNNEFFTGTFSTIFMSRNCVKSWDEQAFTVQASGRHCQLHPQAPKMIFVSQNDRRFVKGKENLYRRMTIREIARIQGFPDSFKFIYANADDAYKMIGNAVPVPLAYEIAVAIRAAIH